MNIVTQANVVRDCGGHLVAPELPSRKLWDAMLLCEDAQLQALIRNGGCGVALFTFGVGRPWVKCGSPLTGVDGQTKIQRCQQCRMKQT